MDRIDAMKVFVTALDEGSLSGAGRKLGRSPAAVSRAVAFLEGHVDYLSNIVRDAPIRVHVEQDGSGIADQAIGPGLRSRRI
jgi:hypothetical protein